LNNNRFYSLYRGGDVGAIVLPFTKDFFAPSGNNGVPLFGSYPIHPSWFTLKRSAQIAPPTAFSNCNITITMADW
jgi:hypothetical protein